MTLRDCLQRLEAELISGEDALDVQIESVAASDLLSDLLATTKRSFILITGLATPQVVRTTEMMGGVGIVFCRGKHPTKETIGMANVHGIPLMSTRLAMFEACCRFAGIGLEKTCR